MTPTALTARLLLFMRDLSPEKAAAFCELIHDMVDSALEAENLADVKGFELISTMLRVAAERQRQELAEVAK